ncbi:MAG: apolipoprotein N-acyltransferase [Phycisphaerales bacterium]
MGDRGDSPAGGKPWAWRGIALLCGVAYGGLTVGSFPPFDLWGLALVAVAPLAWVAAAGRARPFSLAFWGAIGTAPFWLFEHWWVRDVSAVGLAPMVIYLYVYPGLFVWISARAARRWPRVSMTLVAPVVWGGLEFLRGRVAFDGYPWYLAGHPLVGAPGLWLSWAAAYVGAFGVSTLAVVSSGLLADALRGRLGAGQVIGGVVVIAWAGLGAVLAYEPGDAGTLRVAVVQTNVPQDNKIGWTPTQRVRDFERFLELTREAVAGEPSPDLVVWPETMSPGDTLDPESLETERAADLVWLLDGEYRGATSIGSTMATETLLLFQQRVGVPMLVGATAYDNLRIETDQDGAIRYDADAIYNAAFVIDGGRVVEPWYDKIHLTPFGEVMPYISLWPWLEKQLLAIGANGMSFELAEGTKPVRVHVPTPGGDGVDVATPICFEATMSGVCRRLVYERGRRRAGLMINLTNDGWFGDSTAGRRTHLLCARWRCIELGTPMVRAANTGISAVIDARGQVVRDRLDGGGGPDRVDGVLTEDVPLASGATAYARIGDLAGWATLAGAGLVLLAGFAGRGPKAPVKAKEGQGPMQ